MPTVGRIEILPSTTHLDTCTPPDLRDKESQLLAWSPCLRYECNWDAVACDTFDETNFGGPNPPCCVHIMRDMAREFDRVMCQLGLEYFVTFGMLLGFERADKIIPWTTDNDYLMTIDNIMAMIDLWEQADSLNHGLEIVYDLLWRVCVGPEFANGQLGDGRWCQTRHTTTPTTATITTDTFFRIFSICISTTKVLQWM